MTEGSLRNHFLIAMPGLKDPIFSQSVTYICEHNDEGAMGVVINHPLEITLGDIFDQMSLEHDGEFRSTPVLAGGPVHIERGFVLHSSNSSWQSTLKITDEISLTGSRDIVSAMARKEGPEQVQFALGYAGWTPGQLEEELAANSWLTLPADSSIIFSTPIEQRWTAAARELGVDINLISSVSGHA